MLSVYTYTFLSWLSLLPDTSITTPRRPTTSTAPITPKRHLPLPCSFPPTSTLNHLDIPTWLTTQSGSARDVHSPYIYADLVDAARNRTGAETSNRGVELG